MTLSVLERGDGPLILFLHGFPDTPHAWLPVMERLPEFRCVAPFLRGYAPSPVDGPYDVDTLAADVASLGDMLSPAAPYAVVGHDWGAVIAYVLGERARLRSMITMSVPYPASFLGELGVGQLRRSWYMAFFQLGSIADRAVERDDFAFIDRLYRAWSPSLRADLSEVKRALRASHPAPLEYYRALPGQLRRRWPKLTVPTLYLVGAEDGCISPTLGREQHVHYEATFAREVIAGAGHFLQWERPEVVADRIRSWLTLTPQ
jgi:pimeloyl-ACP methyl ester carboxylesterase